MNKNFEDNPPWIWCIHVGGTLVLTRNGVFWFFPIIIFAYKFSKYQYGK